MFHTQINLLLPDVNATEALGAALARAFSAAKGSAVFYLYGDLGAGKTTCVRSLLRELGVQGTIRSPTYTLVEAYYLPDLTCIHVDLYRVQGPAEVEELGLRDYFDSDCLLLVEWPEKGAEALPPADIELTLSYRGDARECRLAVPSARAAQNLARVASWAFNLEHDSSLTPYVSNKT